MCRPVIPALGKLGAGSCEFETRFCAHPSLDRKEGRKEGRNKEEKEKKAFDILIEV